VKRISKLGIATIIALAVVLALPTAALAIPSTPHAFVGNVTIGGEPALDGTTVSAWVKDTELFASTVTLAGKYGENPAFKVPADDPDTPLKEGAVDGDIIIFKVGTQVADTDPAGPIKFEGGKVSQVNLSITGPLPPTLTAEAGGPYSGTTGASIALSGSATGGTPPYTYAWDLDGDGQYDDAFDLTTSYSWSSAATHNIGFRVTDSVPATATDTATVKVTTKTPPSGGGAAPTTYYTDTDLFGNEESFRISSDGKIQETIEATSADGNLTITIPKDTVALDKNGKRLASLEVAIDESPPDPPADANIIGLAYDFGPAGATFDPAISLTWSYDPDALPEGVAEADLVLAYYDEEATEWVELDGVVDTVNNTITASVAHFTTFAIIGSVTPPTPPAPARFTVSSLGVSPSEVAPGEEVTISVLVANTGGESGSYTVVLKIDGTKEDEERVTVAAGGSKTVTFSVTKEEAGSYTVTVDGRSGSFTVVPVVVSLEPAAFSVSNLSIQPAEVEAATAVTIAVLVSNTGGTEGSYTQPLTVHWYKESEKPVTIPAGGSKTVSFSLTRDEPGTYSVSVDGLSGSFTVVLPVKPPGVNWPLIGGIIGGVVVVAGLLYYFLVFRRRAY